MEYTTPGGHTYEVEDIHSFFSEVSSQDPLQGSVMARVIQRMEWMLQERERDNEETWQRYRAAMDELSESGRRLAAAEDKIDELAGRLFIAEEDEKDDGISGTDSI